MTKIGKVWRRYCLFSVSFKDATAGLYVQKPSPDTDSNHRIDIWWQDRARQTITSACEAGPGDHRSDRTQLRETSLLSVLIFLPAD